MDIAIITYCNSTDNYGQILQHFALQTYFRLQNHSPFLIRYDSSKDERSESSQPTKASFPLLKYFLHPKTYISLFFLRRKDRLYSIEEAKHNRGFADFINANITSSSVEYNRESIRSTPPAADLYVCGSDQIWGGGLSYYLDFVGRTHTKIAYAPSFGGISTFSPDYEQKLRAALSEFAFVGMREESGVATCKRLGRKDAVKVCDPTLLLSKEEYRKVEDGDIPKERYILLYLLGSPTSFKVKEAYHLAKQMRCKVIYIAAQGQYDKYPKTYASIGQWLRLIEHAELVVTNSFHGTVFSLLFSTPFVTIPLSGNYSRMNTRVTELLSECGLQNRLYANNLTELANSHIDFSAFEKYQKLHQEQAGKYLMPFLTSKEATANN